MPWAKIDDQLHTNAKFAEVSLAATGLWTLSLSWTAGSLTDGFIPAAMVSRLGGAKGSALAKELVRAGLWESAEGGYQFHDYLKYNPPSGKVQAERDAAKERMARVRAKKFGECSPEQSANQSRSSSYPVPVPISSKELNARHNTNSADEDCQELVTKLYCAYRQGLHKDRSLVEPISNDAPWAEVKPHLAALDQLLAIGATPDQVLRATAKLRAEYEPKGLPTTLNGLISAWARVNVPSPVPLSFKTPEPQLAPEIEISEEEAQRRIAEILAGPKTPKPVWEPLA